ncbi:nose resistant to fluoxetine protein 6 [Octopus sinensis]|uniref:Nose resistant to fluoxetine protein 6 n=1 Tax=Octopus sinensis TaxID=2607531 RepID=A0A6P7TVZ9_9MOLL|nr:nose resistant to fluoxetine protein 6 [Octopus sinensis]
MLLGLYFQTRVLLLLSLIAIVGSQFPQPPPYWEIWSSALTAIRNKTFLSKEASYLETVYNEFEPSFGAPGPSKVLLERAERLSSIDICEMLASLGINTKCCAHTGMIFSSVAKKETWALQMLDSFGKFPTGIMQGNIHMVGSYEECRAVKVAIPGNYTGHPALYRPFGPKYCQLIFQVKVEVMQVLTTAPIQYGVCIPDTCSSKDLYLLINNGIHLLPFKSTKNYSALAYCEAEPSFDGKAIFSIVTCSLFLALLVFATLYHVTCYQDQVTQPKPAASNSTRHGVVINASVDPSDPDTHADDPDQADTVKLLPVVQKEPSLLGRILKCFSVYHNGSKLLNTDQAEGTLSCIHGVRFLSMAWVLIGHVYAFGIIVIMNPTISYDIIKGFAFQAIANALVSVDSFFLLSGLLVSYSTLRAMKANGGKMNWFYFYIHRFWRLTPPYMLLMMLYIPLFRYMGHGPFWPPQGLEKDFCKNSWYYNLFYINNFMPNASKNMCMGWSWYLANDMQFYWISPLIIIPLYKSAKLGHLVALLLLVAHFVTTAVIATLNHSAITFITQQQ